MSIIVNRLMIGFETYFSIILWSPILAATYYCAHTPYPLSLSLSNPHPLSLDVPFLDLREKWVASFHWCQGLASRLIDFFLFLLSYWELVTITSCLLFFLISWGIKKGSWLLQKSRKERSKRVQELISIQAWFKPIQTFDSSKQDLRENN